MKLDPGLIIVIIAVLVFYLRLSIIQRERVRRARMQALSARKQKGKKAANTPMPSIGFAIVSHDRRDWIIAGIGAALMILGILIYTAIIPFDWARSLWWLPTALGIVAFSWGFK